MRMLNGDMLGYGKTLGRGLGRELAQPRKINVMDDWRQTTNEAMDGRRHMAKVLFAFQRLQDQRDERLEANNERGDGRPATWSRCSWTIWLRYSAA